MNNSYTQQINLLIGGFHIQVESTSEDVKLNLDIAWTPFVNLCEQEPEIMIYIHPGMPDWIINAPEIFGGLTYENMGIYTDSLPWSIRKYEDQRVIVTGDHDYAATINKEGTVYHVYSRTGSESFPIFNLFPYPLGPLLLYYIAVSHDAVLLHSSGVFDEGKGRIFSGFSGVGKSTMAGLWQKRGARVVNDDRLLIRQVEGEFRMYNSPMFYMDVPKFAKIDTVCLLKQTPFHQHRHLSVIEAASRILGFCIQHAYDADHLQKILGTVTALAASIQSYELGFALNTDVVDYVRKNM